MTLASTLSLNREGIRPGDRLCAAVSGGADSVALLLSLYAQRETLGVGVSAAHVHHGMRGDEADGDLAFVHDLCARLDVPLHVYHTSVPDRVRATGESTEEAARHLRYAFFRSLLVSGEADSVLTAHTLDDQAETVLLKLLRGAWTEGLSAIHPAVAVKAGARSGIILRPFLEIRRAEIEVFLHAVGQPWREDSTNAETLYTRNRVRHQLLPALRDFNPAIDRALANLAELARADEEHWQRSMAQLLPQLLLPGKPVRGGGRAVSASLGEQVVAIELERLRGLDLSTRRRVLRAAARHLGVRLGFEDIARLISLVEAKDVKSTSGNLQLARNLGATRSLRELRLVRRPESDTHRTTSV